MVTQGEHIAGQALPELWVACYDDLKVLARSRIRSIGDDTMLDTTALVHDSYLKLLRSSQQQLDATQRRQFFCYASGVMRSVIIDLARERQAERRGGGAVFRLDTQMLDSVASQDDDPLFVDDALRALRAREPRLAQVVEMRFFGGFTEPEIAETLGISERTVRNDWDKARALMRLLLQD